MKHIILAIILFTISLPSHAAANAKNENHEITANGLGVFTIGSSLKEVNKNLKKKIFPHEISERATPNCDYNEIPELPGISFVFIDDRLMRIDVEKPNWRYGKGVFVGMAERDVLRRLKHATSEPLDFVPTGITYVVGTDDAPNAISFQFEEGRLARMIAGDKKVIRYAEVCM